MRAAVYESAALALLLGLAVCAEGIAAIPGGWWLLCGGLALAWLLGKLAHWEIPYHARKGKKKTAPVLQHQSGGVRNPPVEK